MPIYVYQCEKCSRKLEIRQSLLGGVPLCCGKAMKKLPTLPAMFRMKDEPKILRRSKGYKDGYSKEYLRRMAETDPTNPKYKNM